MGIFLICISIGLIFYTFFSLISPSKHRKTEKFDYSFFYKSENSDYKTNNEDVYDSIYKESLLILLSFVMKADKKLKPVELRGYTSGNGDNETD